MNHGDTIIGVTDGLLETGVIRLHASGYGKTCGIICGTVTGFTVGAVDAYKLFKGGTVKQADLPRVAFHEMGRSAVIVAGFFGIYQTVKTGLGFAGVEYPEIKVGTATMVGAAPLSITPGLRRYVPYCLTLVAVDTYHSYFAPGADGR